MRTGESVLRSLWILLAMAVPLCAQHVMLNEIYYDTIGPDDPNIMYTELYGPPGTDLSGYTLVGLDGNQGGVEYLTVTLSGTIPADGYFVVGGAGVENVDLIYPHNWQNAGGVQGDACDCIHLRYQGNNVDKVRYGACESGHECEGEGDGSVPDVYIPENYYSIGRLPDHQDTDDNAEDWRILDHRSPGEPNDGGPCEIYYYNLIEVQEDNADGTPLHAGEFAHVSGIASVSNYVFDPTVTDFYIQDENAGVNIFGSNGTFNIIRGDCVVVEGWIAHYNGLCEIASSGSGNCVWDLDIVDHVDTPEPLTITCNTVSQYGENYEGMVVQIDGVSITGGDPWPSEGNNANLDISDGTGTCIMRIDKDTDIDGAPQLPDPFLVVGILTQYDNTTPYTDGYQIMPRSYYDLLSPTDELPIEIPKSFRLVGCYPNPFNAQTKIVFTVAHLSIVTVQIFDLLGRQVMISSVPVSSPGEHVYIWDGTNQVGEMVGAGIYFIRLATSEASATGKLLFLK